MSKVIRVLTPTGSQVKEVVEDMTVGELRELMGLAEGFKASASSVPIEDDALVANYDRIAFAGKAESGTHH